ncbi:hypothetical protein F5Y15DRAFT_290457 [Xylariaceae sp. FL0016]|nr:hypothetical protein F5Y15DRAFT_290457 [Xylariaceae sp. FL0016]
MDTVPRYRMYSRDVVLRCDIRLSKNSQLPGRRIRSSRPCSFEAVLYPNQSLAVMHIIGYLSASRLGRPTMKASVPRSKARYPIFRARVKVHENGAVGIKPVGHPAVCHGLPCLYLLSLNASSISFRIGIKLIYLAHVCWVLLMFYKLMHAKIVLLIIPGLSCCSEWFWTQVDWQSRILSLQPVRRCQLQSFYGYRRRRNFSL